MNHIVLAEIQKSIEVLKRGGTILYPTDTIWGLGCDATNTRAIRKLHHIKQRSDHKHFIILLGDTSQIKDYVKVVPDTAWDLYHQIDNPLTIVFPGAKNLPRRVIGSDRSVGIRIPRDDFAQELVRSFGKPLISTSANISGDAPPMFFREISPQILQSADYIVDYHRERVNKTKPSTIIRIHINGDFEILRK